MKFWIYSYIYDKIFLIIVLIIFMDIIFDKHIFAFLASAIAIYTELRYIYTIIKRKTVPIFSSWFLMAMSMTFVFFSSLKAWGGISIMLIWVLAILHIIETILSFKYWVFKLRKLDKSLISISIFSLVIWYFTDNPIYAILINTFIDTSWLILIWTKLFKFPWTEDKQAWILSALMYWIDILAISDFTFANSFFVCLNFVECSLIAILSYRRMPFLQSISFKIRSYFLKFEFSSEVNKFLKM